MANGFESLRKLTDVLSLETARISGDPQRLQLALGETQARKAQEMDALLNQQIDKMNLPDVQKTFLKAMTAKDKYNALYEQKDRKVVKDAEGYYRYVDTGERVFPGVVKTPKDPMTEKQKYDELAAQIKQEIALRGRGSAAFDEQQGGNPNLLEFYDTYIVGGNIDPFKAALAGLFGQNNGATPPPSQKSYKVIGASYSGQSADKVIQNAMTVNPGMSKEKVIQNLIAQGIISEG
jgi:hypothetical protein